MATMEIMKIGDLEMHYEVQGDGQPLVLISGYTCDHTFWDQLAPDLATRFRVVTFDNRGVGRTKDNGQLFSIETMASDTAALIQYLGLPKVTVIGQSMGGVIAQAMLATYPDLCGKCAILNSTQ